MQRIVVTGDSGNTGCAVLHDCVTRVTPEPRRHTL